MQADAIGGTTLILLGVSWIIFCALFLFRKKSPKAQEAKRAPSAAWGMVLQGLGFALIWSLPRRQWWPFRPSVAGELALSVVSILLAYASCILCWQAVRTLGKQWTYQARVIQGHELITQGPYSVVRNPIYLGMFGLILSMSLAFSRWWSGLLAVALFLIGNRIRIRAEERLLRETFGDQFDEYARRVPPFIPHPWR